MGRKHSNTQPQRPQVSKRARSTRPLAALGIGDDDLMRRFNASRDRDREGMGR